MSEVELELREVAVNQKHLAQAIKLESQERKTQHDVLYDAFGSFAEKTERALRSGHDRFAEIDSRIKDRTIACEREIERLRGELDAHRRVAITAESLVDWVKEKWWLVGAGILYLLHRVGVVKLT